MQELVAFAPGVGMAWTLLGSASWQLQDYPEAARAARALANLKPGDAEAKSRADGIAAFARAWQDSVRAAEATGSATPGRGRRRADELVGEARELQHERGAGHDAVRTERERTRARLRLDVRVEGEHLGPPHGQRLERPEPRPSRSERSMTRRTGVGSAASGPAARASAAVNSAGVAKKRGVIPAARTNPSTRARRNKSPTRAHANPLRLPP